MVSFVEQLQVQSEQLKALQAARAQAGMLTGKGAFIETYNNLIATGKVFAHDTFHDRYYYDGREVNGAVLAELRGVVAQGGSADRGTVWDAVRALCRKHPCEHVKDQRQDAIETILAEDQGVVRRITIHGVSHWCVAMRDLKRAVDVKGVDGARRVYAIMRELGWQARPVFIYGRRMRYSLKLVMSLSKDIEISGPTV
jgi:hypothetical protein